MEIFVVQWVTETVRAIDLQVKTCMRVLAESVHQFENVYNLSVINVHNGTIIFVRVNIQDQLVDGLVSFT